MLFLETENGELIAEKYIVRIGALSTRRCWHKIDYQHGGEPRTTTASEAAVKRFLTQARIPRRL